MMWDDVFNSLYEEIMKERMKKDMKLEYKFYEKNLAPKWLEGDYNLHIEGNRMTMTSKDGKKVETRCHPEDDWRLQIGLDELKDRMNEAKKPREIKVGDMVRFLAPASYSPYAVCDFFETSKVAAHHITRTMYAARFGYVPSKTCMYKVLCVGNHLDSSTNKNVRVALIRDETSGAEFVVRLERLELVE